MLNIANPQRNADQNHKELSPHTCRKAIIKKTINKKCWWGCGEKGTLMHSWWECKLVQPLWRTVQRFLKRLKIELLVIQQYHSWVWIYIYIFWLCDPMDCNPSDSSVHGISQAKNIRVGDRLPLPPPGDLPTQGLNPCLQAFSWKALDIHI